MVLFLAIFAGMIAYATLHGPRYRAEICVAFNGRTACKTVSAKSEQAAIRSGTDGGCADIASGVTETMKCEGAEPASVKWLQRP